MKILALITARGGSKGLLGKNISMLGGKPLIVWSIDVVKDIPEICDILLSTDDTEIAAVGGAAGAFVPWLRPDELATDTASPVDAALHALDWYEAARGQVDGVVLLQPTSPLRTRQTVLKGIELFGANNRQCVLGVSPISVHPMWTLKIEGNHLVPFMKEHGLEGRSQDLPLAVVVDGSFYLISPEELRDRQSFIGVKTVPLLIESPQEALDIDTPWDFKIAELIVEAMHAC